MRKQDEGDLCPFWRCHANGTRAGLLERIIDCEARRGAATRWCSTWRSAAGRPCDRLTSKELRQHGADAVTSTVTSPDRGHLP